MSGHDITSPEHVQSVRAGIASARMSLDIAGYKLTRDPAQAIKSLDSAISLLTASRDLLAAIVDPGVITS